jgi:hypothetical protein
MNQNQSDPESRKVLESAWRSQSLWSETANLLKAKLSGYRKLAAVLAVMGAVFETAAATLFPAEGVWSWICVFIAAVGTALLIVAPYVLRTKASRERVSEWVRARSASEALKETIYRYLVAARPFNATSQAADLIDRLSSIKEKVQDLNIYAASVDPPRKERPLELTPEEYVESRVNDQIENFYLPKGREKARRAEKLHNWELVFGAIAAILGGLSTAAAFSSILPPSFIGPWVAVVTNIAAAITAHLAASRYDHEAIIYFGTADRLTALRDKWVSDRDKMEPARVDRFVDDCEHAISTENEAWLAKWTKNQPQDTAQS